MQNIFCVFFYDTGMTVIVFFQEMLKVQRIGLIGQ